MGGPQFRVRLPGNAKVVADGRRRGADRFHDLAAGEANPLHQNPFWVRGSLPTFSHTAILPARTASCMTRTGDPSIPPGIQGVAAVLG
jgi:hypothetical protein